MKYVSNTGSVYSDVFKKTLTDVGFTNTSSDSTYDYWSFKSLPFNFRSTISSHPYLEVQIDSSTWRSIQGFVGSYGGTNEVHSYWYESSNVILFSGTPYGEDVNLFIKTSNGWYYEDYPDSGDAIGATIGNDGTFILKQKRTFFGSSSTLVSTNSKIIMVTPYVLTGVAASNLEPEIISGIYSLYTNCPSGTVFSMNGTNLEKHSCNYTYGYNIFAVPYIAD